MPAVTGFQIREQIKSVSADIVQATHRCTSNLYYYPEDGEGPDIKAFGEELLNLETQLVGLQEMLARFNYFTQVEYEGEQTSLLFAIKLLGVVTRLEKVWRGMCTGRSSTYYHMMSRSRSKEEEHAVRSISEEEAEKEAKRLAKKGRKIRLAIAKGNSSPFEITDEEFEFLFSE